MDASEKVSISRCTWTVHVESLLKNNKNLKFLSVIKDSDHSSDDLSSGVFSSCNSQTDGHLEWLASANQPSSYCFEGKMAGLYLHVIRWLASVFIVVLCSDAPGVDIWIENVQGECLRIRERRQVKVGHVAIGISDQV